MLKTFEMVKNAHDAMYAKCGLILENFAPEDKSSAYYAHTFTIKDKRGLFRIAKITPTKAGSFVTIYKRGVDSIISPYEVSDSIDFVVIAVVDGNNVGEFVFSKTVLCEKNIFSIDGKEGKRAMRVYAPWDKITSAQALNTRKWQGAYFANLNPLCMESTLKLNNLFAS